MDAAAGAEAFAPIFSLISGQSRVNVELEMDENALERNENATSVVLLSVLYSNELVVVI